MSEVAASEAGASETPAAPAVSADESSVGTDGLDEAVGSEPGPDEEADERLDVVIDESLPWVEGELGLALDLDALEVEAEDLRARLLRVGPVNLVAIDEYDQLAERHDFLASERDDLVESIRSLRKTIDEIDELSRRLFLEAFEQVRASFDQAFQTLFRGGRAELRLQEDEDPLECGIEIIAQPPGKRLQNMMLLSGGEKALTAIALLFALFRYKPSPFCILDEVDAPLDEANVMRFIGLVEELAVETQFIVITHNRRTMERGDVLYGVTMEEPGCSKLVSVHFQGLAGSAA
jgi:chromosome segregation protein